MFNPISIPYDSVMLFNKVQLKPGVSIEDVELALGEMCNVVKNTYRDDGGFIAGQVFKFTGFASEEGSINSAKDNEEHIAIVTYWKSFWQHEASHADNIFRKHFSELLEYAESADELGYELLWQGEPE